MFKDKNLLVLSHTYNSFIKDPVEILAKQFNKVYVLVRYQPVAELSRYIPLSFFKSRAKYSKRYSIDLTDKPKNIEVIPVPLWYLPFRRFYYSVGRKHARVALRIIKKRNIKFDLIHAHFAWSSGYAGIKIKERYNKPLVVTGHGYDVYDLPFRNEKFRKSLTEILRQADQVLTVSEKNNQALKILGVNNAMVLPNGYTNDLFHYCDRKESRRKLGLSMDRKIILTIGNLDRVKGYKYLIKAMTRVKKRYPNVLCLHIGTGPLEESLKKMVASYKLKDNFKFLGRKPHNELKYYFGACDIFALSSLSEGNPTVMFEALGSGKPFIGTSVGGIPKVINSPDYGLLCEPENEIALSKNILEALEIKWDSQKILDYSKNFSWEDICDKILEVYSDVLS